MKENSWKLFSSISSAQSQISGCYIHGDFKLHHGSIDTRASHLAPSLIAIVVMEVLESR